MTASTNDTTILHQLPVDGGLFVLGSGISSGAKSMRMMIGCRTIELIFGIIGLVGFIFHGAILPVVSLSVLIDIEAWAIVYALIPEPPSFPRRVRTKGRLIKVVFAFYDEWAMRDKPDATLA
ncbi:hypothetical protein F5I97DRAFT_1826990 [Phlebopus sp. FC_14]|nr:hypothetical protein F5I97DRAFT_1826990 [Phlebopus sp. FC_14]